jgi:hypothetical protein
MENFATTCDLFSPYLGYKIMAFNLVQNRTISTFKSGQEEEDITLLFIVMEKSIVK